ncbi:putative membrane protein [Halobacteriovorax marinus SJ]|uniref:Membrane protein n=1 Tax=Halobacteriovorax marinus (strain ATCC BAA-682 / DSM 15412 / SJ) TaxID=862908 RepID=E1X4C8_HALMS|nr:hypothetical protein [Halobacteriovorax marinus]CBW27100.1 putative membrane protein [Halobacteriovorax marinus SJ]
MIKDKNSEIEEDIPHIGEPESTDGDQKKTSYKSSRVNVHATTSDLSGAAGILEGFLRKFKGPAFALAMLPIGLSYIVCLGLSLIPGYILVEYVWNEVSVLRPLFICLSLACAYLLYGVSIIFIVPLVNKLMFLKLKPWRGGWYSLQSLPWYYHNALVQLVRYTFLDLVTPTPINVLFYKMMGMKIGKGVMINTTNISDPCLITLEDNVTIGGSATLFAHYAQGGYLVIAPTIIRKGATIGLKASIMGDVVVGEKVTVKPHSILLPKTRINKGDKQV